MTIGFKPVTLFKTDITTNGDVATLSRYLSHQIQFKFQVQIMCLRYEIYGVYILN